MVLLGALSKEWEENLGILIFLGYRSKEIRPEYVYPRSNTLFLHSAGSGTYQNSPRMGCSPYCEGKAIDSLKTTAPGGVTDLTACAVAKIFTEESSG